MWFIRSSAAFALLDIGRIRCSRVSAMSVMLIFLRFDTLGWCRDFSPEWWRASRARALAAWASFWRRWRFWVLSRYRRLPLPGLGRPAYASWPCLYRRHAYRVSRPKRETEAFIAEARAHRWEHLLHCSYFDAISFRWLMSASRHSLPLASPLRTFDEFQILFRRFIEGHTFSLLGDCRFIDDECRDWVVVAFWYFISALTFFRRRWKSENFHISIFYFCGIIDQYHYYAFILGVSLPRHRASRRVKLAFHRATFSLSFACAFSNSAAAAIVTHFRYGGCRTAICAGLHWMTLLLYYAPASAFRRARLVAKMISFRNTECRNTFYSISRGSPRAPYFSISLAAL